MVAKLISTGSTEESQGVVATILDEGQIKEVALSDAEAKLPFPTLAKNRGWERPTEADMNLYRQLRGPGPTIVYGEGVKEKIDDFLKRLGKER